MPIGATVTADGITTHGTYAYTPPPAFFAAGAVPSGAGVFIPSGLVASASHDNRPAIQAAIDAATAAGGGIVYIAAGIYGVGSDPSGNGAIEVKNNVFIKGAGMGDTVLRVLDHVGDKVTGIIRSPHGEETNNYGVSDITLDGNRANNDPVTEHVDGFFSGGTPGDTITDHDATLLRVEIRDCSGYGFDPHERTERLLIDSCVAHHNCKDGFVADYIVDGEYRNNLAYANDRHGFNITTTTNDFLVHDNIARDNGSTGLVIQRGSFDIPVPFNIAVRDNVFTGNAREGVLVQMGENILIEDNRVSGNGRSGVRIYGASHVTVAGNTIYGSSQSSHDGYADIQIREYDDRLGVTGSVYAARANLIEGNTLKSGGAVASSYGVEESAGAAGANEIRGNAIWGQVRGVFKLSAADTIVSHRGTALGERIEGNALANRFDGRAGDDILKGHGGDDILIGGAGADAMSGGTGDDIYFVDDIDDKITEAEGEGFDRAVATATYSLKANVEVLQLAGNGDIDGTGNAFDNILKGNGGGNILSGKEGHDKLYGNAGADTLKGGDGNDRLIGGEGADRMAGGLGNDAYYVDDAGDDISEKRGEGNDQVFSSVSLALKDNIEKLVLIGGAAIDGKGNGLTNKIIGNEAANVLSGEAGNDQLSGMGGNDTLKGGLGNDSLDGGAGADSMAGGAGDDTYFVDNAGDDANEKPGEGYDAVIARVSHTLKADIEALYLAGGAYEGKGNGGANIIAGTGNGNLLRGADGNDALYGYGGGDVLKGGAGSDTLAGGTDADIFSFDSASEAASDTIADFIRAEGDRIDLASVDAGTDPGHQDFVFTGNRGFFGYGRELCYEAVSGGVRLLGDIDGDRAADLVVYVNGVSSIIADDLII
jgi:parallel beta-helix repeat protein